MIVREVTTGPRKGKASPTVFLVQLWRLYCSNWLPSCKAYNGHEHDNLWTSLFSWRRGRKKLSYTVAFCWLITMLCSVVMHLLWRFDGSEAVGREPSPYHPEASWRAKSAICFLAIQKRNKFQAGGQELNWVCVESKTDVNKSRAVSPFCITCPALSFKWGQISVPPCWSQWGVTFHVCCSFWCDCLEERHSETECMFCYVTQSYNVDAAIAPLSGLLELLSTSTRFHYFQSYHSTLYDPCNLKSTFK
jgi:hypothetical protein